MGISPERLAKRIKHGKGLIVPSAEGVRFAYTERPLPKPSIDERAAEAAKAVTATLVRVELAEELSETWSCFEETQPDGSVTGRLWVHREPVDLPAATTEEQR